MAYLQEHFNGKKFLVDNRWVADTALHLHTDASGAIGYGAVFGTNWFHGLWPDVFAPFHITFKELFPITIALEIWGNALQNRCLIIHTDNIAVVQIVNKQTSKEPNVMHLVRRLVLACMKFNILIKSVHVPGKLNVLPDLLSRF